MTGKGRSIHIRPAAARGQGRGDSLFGWERYFMFSKSSRQNLLFL